MYLRCVMRDSGRPQDPGHRKPSREVRFALDPRGRPGVAVLLLLLLAAATARADTARMTAAIGYGAAGLFHDEYVDGATRGSEMGHFQAGAYGVDLAFVLPSHLILGVRARTLGVEIGNGTRVGRLDLIPATLLVGYRRPALAGRLGGFLALAAGVATARFTPAATITHWRAWGDETGTDFVVNRDFTLELALTSAFLNTEVAYQPAPVDDSGFAPGRAYRVKGRHLMVSLALRWWVEFW
jgi:hypothetical protein